MTDKKINQQLQQALIERKSQHPRKLSIIEQQRQRIYEVERILQRRIDVNMDVPNHDLVYEKAKRLGNGKIAPLPNSLEQKMKVPKETNMRWIPVTTIKGSYQSVLDGHQYQTERSPVAGLSRKFDKTQNHGKLGWARLFPQYGLTDARRTFVSNQRNNDVTEDQHKNEAQNKCKLFFKQKYEQKEFIEVLLRAKVNPNKRE